MQTCKEEGEGGKGEGVLADRYDGTHLECALGG